MITIFLSTGEGASTSSNGLRSTIFQRTAMLHGRFADPVDMQQRPLAERSGPALVTLDWLAARDAAGDAEHALSR